MFDLEDCMAFVTSRSGKVFSEALGRRLCPYNVTRTQWIAMYYIHKNHKLTQRELAEIMSLREPTVVRMLQQMELAGYLVRNSSEEDRRRKHLELSPKGEKFCLDLLPVVEQFKEDTTQGISQEDLEKLKDILAKMVENAEKQI